MTSPERVDEDREELAMAGFGSIEGLRQFVRDHYAAAPPRLVWISGIPLREGGGVRYEYADGSRIEACGGRWTWFADDGKAPLREGSWDPSR